MTGYLGQLVSLDGPLPASQTLAAQEAFTTLLASALKGETLERQRADAIPGSVLRQRVLSFIEQNFQSGDVTPEAIQRRFNVSRAHLYRAFAADGGVAKLVQGKRLDAAFLELLKSGKSSRSITDIAFSMGFSSGNQLLRSFRARFGMTPSEARNEGGTPPVTRPHAHDVQTHFAEVHRRTVQAEPVER
ncbi:hypothetical protein GCM10019059_41470 [Camelimonas fluminis]|uniref:Helix-turn-helix domain-containing protein n=1 Tax=Camelimonas fluminis TaxID=1576911 RepID=A0ABV7UGN3_9HYPH|nr:helix-turn-helix domain-containing protein [Camelimonas fluminis]GHE78378.1 hypothetical protein GCM10019059_41470 [Camelimonas fluminis]